MKKIQILITERHRVERTLALSRPLDEDVADKFLDIFYECFCKSPIVKKIVVSLHEAGEI